MKALVRLAAADTVISAFFSAFDAALAGRAERPRPQTKARMRDRICFMMTGVYGPGMAIVIVVLTLQRYTIFLIHQRFLKN